MTNLLGCVIIKIQRERVAPPRKELKNYETYSLLCNQQRDWQEGIHQLPQAQGRRTLGESARQG